MIRDDIANRPLLPKEAFLQVKAELNSPSVTVTGKLNGRKIPDLGLSLTDARALHQSLGDALLSAGIFNAKTNFRGDQNP